jgi:hypothetical protein
MPRFYREVEADIDIDVEDFIYECSDRDIEKIIQILVEEGKLPKTLETFSKSQNLLMTEKMWYETTEKIRNNRLSLSIEEIEIIENIAKIF